jgi:hypothetical protein
MAREDCYHNCHCYSCRLGGWRGCCVSHLVCPDTHLGSCICSKGGALVGIWSRYLSMPHLLGPLSACRCCRTPSAPSSQEAVKETLCFPFYCLSPDSKLRASLEPVHGVLTQGTGWGRSFPFGGLPLLTIAFSSSLRGQLAHPFSLPTLSTSPGSLCSAQGPYFLHPGTGTVTVFPLGH